MADLFSKYVSQDVPESKILDATTWFRKKASEIEKVDTQKILKENSLYLESRFRVGNLYIFRYDPKLKDQLPYYDIFPVVFVVSRNQKGILALNMHYLPLAYRARLMDALYEYSTGQDDLKRLKINYRILTAVSKLKYFRPCLKYYLNSNIRSRYLRVDSREWDTALFLPLQKFKKSTVQVVYKDSINTIKKYNLKGNLNK